MHRNYLVWGCAFAVALSLLPVRGFTAREAGPRPVIAVLDFGAMNTSAGDAAVVSSFVRQSVVKAGSFDVVDKANMERILAEQAFQQTGCTDQECAVKLGKVLNAQKMIVGSFALLGSMHYLTGQLVDVETGKIVRTAKEKGFSIEGADEAAEKLVAELLRGVRGRPKKVARTKSTVPARHGEGAKKRASLFFSVGGGIGGLKEAWAEVTSVVGEITRNYEKNFGATRTARETAGIVSGFAGEFGIEYELEKVCLVGKVGGFHPTRLTRKISLDASGVAVEVSGFLSSQMTYFLVGPCIRRAGAEGWSYRAGVFIGGAQLTGEIGREIVWDGVVIGESSAALKGSTFAAEGTLEIGYGISRTVVLFAAGDYTFATFEEVEATSSVDLNGDLVDEGRAGEILTGVDKEPLVFGMSGLHLRLGARLRL